MKLCPKCQKQFSDDANFCPVDAARLVPLEAPAVAADSLTAKFELGDRLGGDRTGSVYRATDKATGQAVAIKLVDPAVISLPGLPQRLERELKQLERVQTTGVAKVLGSGKRGEDTWVVIELLQPVVTLANAVSARGPMPPEAAAKLIEIVGEALIQAAQVGVVHRDLAPKNILFVGDEVKLINFSLPVPSASGAPGVAEFVAPEQIEGKAVDQRSNLYSLGAVYYFVLTGQPVQARDGAVAPPSSLAPVPPQVEATILRALDKSPTKRFLTVRQFVDEVSRIARGEPEPPTTIPPPTTRPPKPKAEIVQSTLLGVHGGDAAAPQTIAERSPWAPPGDGPPTEPMTVPPVESATPPPGAIPVVAAPAASPAQMLRSQPVPVVRPNVSPVMSQPIPRPDLSQIPEAAASPPSMLRSQPVPVLPMPAAPVVAAAPAVQPAAPSVAATQLGVSPVAVAPAAASAVAELAAPAAPVVPAPLLAGPLINPAGHAPAGKKSGDGSTKGKFRETMWFKKGELDAQAAQAAAEERARGKEGGHDKTDLLPIDERYKDDGSISHSDKDKYSLRTGATLMTTALGRESGARPIRGADDVLIDELKSGRNKIIAAIAAGLVVVLVVIFLLAR